MKFSAATVPDLKSDQELLVLCHKNRRVLVPLPDTYEGVHALAKQTFGLNGPLEFETNELAECRGAFVQVRYDTWRIASLLSAQMFVKEATTANLTRAGAGSREVKAEKIPKIVRTIAQEHVSRPVKNEPISAVMPPSNAEIKFEHSVQQRARLCSLKPLTPESSLEYEEPDVGRPDVVHVAKAVQCDPWIESEAEDEDEDEDALMASAVDWSDGECDRNIKEEPKDDAAWLSGGKVKQEPKDDSAWLSDRNVVVKNEGHGGIASSPSQANLQAPVTIPLFKQERSPPQTKSRTSYVRDGTSRIIKKVVRKIDGGEQPKSRGERHVLKSEPMEQVIQPQIPAAEPDEDLITIQVSCGKNKGPMKVNRHQIVNKVLSDVCGRWGLRDQLPRARLVMMIEDDSPGGCVHIYRCEGTKTMAQERAQNGSNCVIDFDDEESES